MKNSLFLKFLEFGIGNIVVLFLGFISTPIITRIISPEQFGRSSMFNTITNIIAVIILVGLDQAFVRFFYEEEEDKRSKLALKSILIPTLLSLMFNVVILISYKYISKLIIGDVSISVILVLCIHNIFLMISRFSLLTIRMQQKAKLYSLLQVIGKISYIVIIVLLFKLYGDNYKTIIYAIVFSNIIMVLISLWSQRSFWISGISNIKSNAKCRTSFKDLIKFGYPLVFTLLINWVFQSIDKISIKTFNGYNELGLYSSALTIIALLNALQSTFNTFWTPISYEKYSENQEDRVFFSKASMTISFIMLILSTFMIMFKDIIILLLGNRYKEAIFIVPFLVFMPLMNTVSETTVIGINFLKKPKYHIHIAILSCITNVIGNLILVPKLGGVGAAISTGISYIVFYMIRTSISVKLYKVNYNTNKFYISTLSLVILSLYSSFNKVNANSIILGLTTIINIRVYKSI